MFVIKRSLDWISESLTHLINTSLETGIFPDKLKLAKIIPIRDLKIYDAAARRRVIKTKQIFIEDNNYE